MKTILSALSLLLFTVSYSQLNIQSGATFFIQAGGKVTVQGDLTSNADIQGTGTIDMKGTALQTINMNGFTIPNLEIDNTNNVTLGTGATRVGTSLLFTNGKLKTGSQDLILAAAATTTGQGATKFVWTDGTGQMKKEVSGAVAGFTMPVGENANYRPATITTTAGTYAVGANVGVRATAGSGNKPPKISDYVNASWPVTKTGISGTATVSLAGTYLDADIVGTEGNLRGYYYSGTDWSSSGEGHNAATNQISAPVTAASGELGGMDKFVAVNSKAFLQGAYNAGAGTMTDNLRTLPSGANDGTHFPLTDPYRSAPYSTTFTHVANTTAETIDPTVLAVASATKSVVDWVFVELRTANASAPYPVIQTRSGLVLRDGSVVDIDGVSPLTFNNLPDANYVLSVRHRNHLGLSTNATGAKMLTEKKSTTALVDLATAPQAQLHGTAANHTTSGAVNLLWGGNSNIANATAAGVVRFTSLNNDKDAIITTAGNSTGKTNVYNIADVNMNKAVKYTGLQNDKDFLYLTVLGSATTTIRSQSLPN